MMWLLYILAYLAVGMVAGRVMFVKELGDSPRTETRFGNTRETRDYSTAQSAGFVTALGWPLIAPLAIIFHFVTAPTGHEKRLAKQKELKELESEIKRLEKEYGLDFRK